MRAGEAPQFSQQIEYPQIAAPSNQKPTPYGRGFVRVSCSEDAVVLFKMLFLLCVESVIIYSLHQSFGQWSKESNLKYVFVVLWLGQWQRKQQRYV